MGGIYSKRRGIGPPKGSEVGAGVPREHVRHTQEQPNLLVLLMSNVE